MNKDNMFGILIVCTGNICRSPMGEGIIQKMIPEDIKQNVYVASAGTFAYEGYPASGSSVIVCSRNDINISNHRSRPVTEELLEKMDVVLTMEQYHKNWIGENFPGSAGKTHTLKGFLHKSYTGFPDVKDPIGADISEYKTIYIEIESEIERILPGLEILIRKKLGGE